MSGAIAYKQETARKHRESSHWEVSASNLHIVVVVVVVVIVMHAAYSPCGEGMP